MPQQNAQKEYLRQQYVGRINRVMDFIEKHLEDDLNLEKLAEIANFSPFHFHRLFSAMSGETLNKFIRRTRLERAASYLSDDQRFDTIAEIGFRCGFSSNAVFSRNFSEYFGMSPTEFRNEGYVNFRKNRKLQSKNSQILSNDDKYFSDHDDYFRSINIHKQNVKIMKVEIKDMPEIHVAYVRHMGNYSEVGNAFEKLMRWAGPRGLLDKPDAKILAVYHDDPGITEESKLRTSVCITIPEGMKTEGEVGTLKITGGKYACGRFEITDEEFSGAWNSMMGEWLPESGYVCEDNPPFELYHNNYEEHPEKKHILDICIPVRPM